MAEFTLNLLCNDYRVIKSQCRTAKYIYLIYTWLTCVLYAFQTTFGRLSQMRFGEYLHLVTISNISWKFQCEFKHYQPTLANQIIHSVQSTFSCLF